MIVPLTDDEFRLFADWIAAEYGLRFGPEKREILRARLEPRRAELGLDSFERLLFHVRFHPDGREERARLVSLLTNNESYFFRESRKLEVLREEVLPALAEGARRTGQRPVRILSVGAASGEEPYTLAIMARETLGPRGVPFQVTGVDVDAAALERARAAVYRSHALRGVPEAVVDRYFEPEDGLWRLTEAIRGTARFQHGNLTDPGWPSTVAAQDVVFCRNVLIYFGEAAVRKAAENLYRSVRPGGYLFLGHAESLSRIPTRFVPERRPGAVFYRRAKE
ncbi:MAG: methyltransferase domain-containing protein [Gemmatimonadetes bacterium]|nr:protein-glutamate O-methyltransferase CheR [Gemmatimonadota bacterium]NIQ54460.1 protein-glutamate O-methyltransferase CheR [Gemmatimonadota bacterium]NIU74670.1 methyltransferase domain-containing protein [Gammaproteobacteria bacterium]NIX44599.1 methyltransferase domain-containing protein [Gemmatimonadota bacterium]NIY08809.1 methyltransferase domain-containing protein [Gemmatimonadota bacterium]